MRVLPVLDLKDRLVVRGVGGRRHEYRPVESRWSADARVSSVADGLRNAYGFRTAYVADLDAIAGGEPAWWAYEALLERGWSLLVDAGIADLARGEALAAWSHAGERIERLIVGLESLPAMRLLEELLRRLTPARVVLSLDLRGGELLTPVADWRGQAPLEAARQLVRAGVRQMIVLDLASVGGGAGLSTLPLCRQLRGEFPELHLITGGGLRHADDLRQLAADGCCDAVLVASALHDGRLLPEELREYLA